MIKVLAMNDDNHDTFYLVQGKEYNSNSFIKFLAQPHSEVYEIHYIYICDPPQKYSNLSDEDWIEKFYAACIYKNPEVIDELWKAGEKY